MNTYFFELLQDLIAVRLSGSLASDAICGSASPLRLTRRREIYDANTKNSDIYEDPLLFLYLRIFVQKPLILLAWGLMAFVS